jgi:hypothetical protein
MMETPQKRTMQNYRTRLSERGLSAVTRTIAGEPPRKGGIVAALRRSPLVGADLDLTRPREEGRSVQI